VTDCVGCTYNMELVNYSSFKFTLGKVCMNHVTDFPHVVVVNSESRE